MLLKKVFIYYFTIDSSRLEEIIDVMSIVANWLLLSKLTTINTLTDYFNLIVGLCFPHLIVLFSPCEVVYLIVGFVFSPFNYAFPPTLGENCEVAYGSLCDLVGSRLTGLTKY